MGKKQSDVIIAAGSLHPQGRGEVDNQTLARSVGPYGESIFRGRTTLCIYNQRIAIKGQQIRSKGRTRIVSYRKEW